jgi:predicted PurR-regulated permease PerM
MQIDTFTTKKWIAITALILFGLLLCYLLSNFITALLGAIIFFILFKPMMDTLTLKHRWKEVWAATLIILISFVIILSPVFTLSYMLYAKITEVLNDPASLFNVIKMFDDRIHSSLGVELFSEENLNSIKAKAGTLIPSFLNEFVWILGNIGIMYFILFYLLTQRATIIKNVNQILPFDIENTRILTNELEAMTLSNIIGVPAIGLIQGTAAGLGYWFFGLQEPFFWGVITAFVSLIPLVGSTLIWLPAALFLLALGQTWEGIGLMAYGGLVVINIDNVARFIIQKRFADVHPVITVFGVIIGLDLFGLPGLVFGPLMLSYFVIFVQMYRKIYKTKVVNGQT